MRKTILLLASVALGVLFASALLSNAILPTAAAQTAPSKPNIVFILTDDMRKDDLRYRYMPDTHSLLKTKGMTFENAFVSHALCCPSRATIMRGQYAHNTGVWSNSSTDSSSTTSGGLPAYKANGGESDNVATRLNAAGYRTGLFGKYLNGYGGTYVPSGWDDWFGGVNMDGDEYYNYDINDNGTIKHFGTGASAYLTDVLSRETQEFIGTSVAQDKPFFAYVAPTAPHLPATPAPRHVDAFDGEKALRLPSFNERDVSDKPRWIKSLPLLTSYQIQTIDRTHEKRAETLRAVDDLVAGVVSKLNSEGVMSNTYIFFTSDNGWHHGEHRINGGKWRPYEEDIRMPLLVRGPGVAAGSTTNKMALNTDYLPTFTNLAGSTHNPTYVPDGRSLLPVLNGTATTWRNAILLEAAADHSPVYAGIRTTISTKPKYIEYSGGARELYYLDSDPYELTNKYNAASPPNVATRLQALKNCKAGTCRTAENGS